MSELIERMLARASTPNATFMRVMQRYKPASTEVFLVVEGKDDSSYYERVARDRSDDEKRTFTTLVAGNRRAVIGTLSLIDWTRYARSRVLFFVDRDYSDFLGDDAPRGESNLYVTDGYSIENSLLNECSVVGLARRSCSGDSFLEKDDEDEICRLYRRAVAEAARVLITITACQIIWRGEGVEFNAERFEPRKYFNANEGVIEAISGIDMASGSIERSFGLPETCCAATDGEREAIVESIVSSGGYERIVRGKYRMRMFCYWMRSLEGRGLPSGARVRPGKVLADVLAEAMAVAPTSRSLTRFIDRNLGTRGDLQTPIRAKLA